MKLEAILKPWYSEYDDYNDRYLARFRSEGPLGEIEIELLIDEAYCDPSKPIEVFITQEA